MGGAVTPPGNAIGLSIVIPTYRRAAGLDRLLTHLRPQLAGHPERELIVVNDGSDDENYAAVAARHRDIMDYVALTGNVGPSAARNAGAARARRGFLVFTDDDCLPPPYWLDWLCAVISGNPDAEVIGGTTRPELGHDAGWFAHFLAENDFYPIPHLRDGRALFFVSANLAVRRSRFIEIGGFNEAQRTAEDRNLTWRLRERRAVLHLDMDWFVYHELSTPIIGHLRRYYRYGRGHHLEVSIEKTPIDRDTFPPEKRPPLFWWRRTRGYFTYAWNKPKQRPRGAALRMLYAGMIVATLLAMDIGFVHTAREAGARG